MAGAGCNLSAMQEPQVQGFMNALQVYAWAMACSIICSHPPAV
jgi:hypothetical protein